MATHSSVLAWKIPWTAEPGKLQSSGRKESDMTEQHTDACAKHCSKSLTCIIVVVVVITCKCSQKNLSAEYYYYHPYFTNEETEA